MDFYPTVSYKEKDGEIIVQKEFSVIWTNNPVDVSKLDGEIRKYVKATKWEDNSTKKGYSGISVSHFPNWREEYQEAEYAVLVYWTLDGEFGYAIDMPKDLSDGVAEVVKKHKADRPVK